VKLYLRVSCWWLIYEFLNKSSKKRKTHTIRDIAPLTNPSFLKILFQSFTSSASGMCLSLPLDNWLIYNREWKQPICTKQPSHLIYIQYWPHIHTILARIVTPQSLKPTIPHIQTTSINHHKYTGCNNNTLGHNRWPRLGAHINFTQHATVAIAVPQLRLRLIYHNYGKKRWLSKTMSCLCRKKCPGRESVK